MLNNQTFGGQIINLNIIETTVQTIFETATNSLSLAEQQAEALNLSVCPEDVYTDDQIAYRVFANMPISIFGIFANIINIIVFCDSEMRTILYNHFLLALSISDLFLLVCNFFFLVLPVVIVDTNSFFWNDLFPVIIRYLDFLKAYGNFRYSYPLALTTQTSGVYLTVLVSVHRFLGVCYPFPAKRWVTRKPVQWAIIGSVMFSIIINIPTWLELSVISCFSEKFFLISRQITLASFHEMTYILIKKTVLYTLLMFIVPFTILITVNWKIIMALKESSNLRTMHTYSTRTVNGNETAEIFKPKFTNPTRDRSVTLMLLAIVALFLGCNGLAFCNSIYESIMLVRESKAEDELEQKLIKIFERSVEISNVLITLNSSTSIIVYVVFSSKYRVILKDLLRLQKREKINRVAVTTAMAAHRAMELSLIPEEIENRKRLEQKLISHNRRGKLFRTQTTFNQSLTNSESNLRLVDYNRDLPTEDKVSESYFIMMDSKCSNEKSECVD